jgi:hypothetical protein
VAGNVGRHHRVSVADLILVQDSVQRTVERLMRELDPEVVGLSVMTFQRRTALALVRLIRAIKPGVQVVVGGYDPSLAPEAYEAPEAGIDYLVRGEGDLTFRDLLSALERGDTRAAGAIQGLSVHDGRRFRHNPARGISSLDDGAIALPNRAARVLGATPYRRSTSSRRRAAAPTTAASRSSRCAVGTSTLSASSACSPTSPMRAPAAPAPSSSSTTTSH